MDRIIAINAEAQELLARGAALALAGARWESHSEPIEGGGVRVTIACEYPTLPIELAAQMAASKRGVVVLKEEPSERASQREGEKG